MGWQARRQDWPALETELRAAAEGICAPAAFEDWARGSLRTVFPHGWLLVILGDYSPLGATPTNCLAVDFPLGYVESVKTLRGQIESPIIKRWFATLRPQKYEVGITHWPEARPAWVENVKRYGIRNVIAHGHLYPREQRFAYLNIVQLPGGITDDHLDFLERATPVICDAATQALSCLPEDTPGAGISLSDREKQVLELAAQGKTDKAIAKELAIAFGTVRTHLKRAGQKLGTSRRAEMVMLAMGARPVLTSAAPSPNWPAAQPRGLLPGQRPVR